jgi:hypothetical protein
MLHFAKPRRMRTRSQKAVKFRKWRNDARGDRASGGNALNAGTAVRIVGI